MEKLVSVIMSTYNEEANWIKESINSILNQTYSNFEFIIVIDNPENIILSDLIMKYKKTDNRVKVLKNQKNIGLVKSLNIALEHCNGEYIARMDADDISVIDRIRKEKEYLEINNLDFVFSGMIMMDQNCKKLYELNDRELNQVEVKKQLGVTNISNHPTWFLKKDVYKKLKGYREVPYCEDYDFSLRALNHGYKIGKVDSNLLMYRVRENSITRSNNFQQSLISLKLIDLYKNNRLDDINYVTKSINKLRNNLTSVEQEKYIKAENLFLQSTNLLKQKKYLQSFKKMMKSISTSKYYLTKINQIIKCKLFTK